MFGHCLQFTFCHKNLEHHETPNPKMKKPLGSVGILFPTLVYSKPKTLSWLTPLLMHYYNMWSSHYNIIDFE